LTPYKGSAAKKIIAGVVLRQDYRMPQMDIDTSQMDALFIDSP